MGALDAFWHALNFIAPALGVAAIATTAAKLLWRHELAGRGWLRLASWTFGAGTLALVGGLLFFGRDGAMPTYAGLVVAAALALWWSGFLRR